MDSLRIMEKEVVNIVKSQFPDLEFDSAFRLFSGTNQIFTVKAGDFSVIFRKFGKNQMISPENERRNFKIAADAGLGPSCLFQNNDYRIEEFIYGETLQRTQVSQYATEIVPSLFAFHSLAKGSGESSTLSFLNSWTHLFTSRLDYFKKNLIQIADEEKEIISCISEAIFSNDFKAKSFLPSDSELVFSHNDFSYGNIIKGRDRYWLIDYEYAGLGHPSIDIASFVIDSMFDYSTPTYQYFPDEEVPHSTQLNLVGTYAELAKIDPDDLWNEVCRGKAVVNYLGILWAACMYEPGNINMLKYSLIRLNLFNKYGLN